MFLKIWFCVGRGGSKLYVKTMDLICYVCGSVFYGNYFGYLLKIFIFELNFRFFE